LESKRQIGKMTNQKITKSADFDEISLELVEKARKVEGRSFANFMAWASLKMAKHILADELDNPEGQE